MIHKQRYAGPTSRGLRASHGLAALALVAAACAHTTAAGAQPAQTRLTVEKTVKVTPNPISLAKAQKAAGPGAIETITVPVHLLAGKTYETIAECKTPAPVEDDCDFGDTSQIDNLTTSNGYLSVKYAVYTLPNKYAITGLMVNKSHPLTLWIGPNPSSFTSGSIETTSIPLR